MGYKLKIVYILTYKNELIYEFINKPDPADH
jgi:hypothetical protein